jgi:hypothetical protein
MLSASCELLIPYWTEARVIRDMKRKKVEIFRKIRGFGVLS